MSSKNQSISEAIMKMVVRMDEETTQSMIEETRNMSTAAEWREEFKCWNYLHRWKMKGQNLPSSIRMRIAKWALECKMYSPIYQACINNNIKLLEQ